MADEAFVHGLNGTPAAPDWPPLRVDELSPILGHYPGLGGIRRIAWHSPRPFAASGLVECERGTVFVKRHASVLRSPADLAEEHRFIDHLRRGGAAVPTVLATHAGATAIAGDCGTYEVHALAVGQDLYRHAESWTPFRSRAHAREAGRALGRLHRAADDFAAPARSTYLLVADFTLFGCRDPIDALQTRLRTDNRLSEALSNRDWRQDMEDVLLPWHANLVPHLPALTPKWAHNDLHASNLLWDDEGAVTCIFDFGLANRTSAVFDLATAIERNCIEWLGLAHGEAYIAHSNLARALIDGYRESAEFSCAQAAALAHLLPLVHTDFALSELAYFHAILHSDAKAELAYRSFLLGHATWFNTQHGRRFLDVLR